MAAALLFSLFVTALSQLTKNLLFTFAAAVGTTLLPTLLYLYGLSGAGYLSFGDFLSAGGMTKFSIKQQVLASDFGVLALYGGAFALVTLVLALITRRKFVK